MAFDQSTRGRLQKLVNSCRGLLSDEFSIQLQQTYGLDPKTGEVTPMARLTHLDDRQRHTAEVLRQTLAHYLGADADDTDHRIAVLDRMVREQAFTVLNRLAALLMMEARGQLIESVSKGYQSRGYKLYSKIAATALGETGQAYQVYLFSVFDELAQELPALFDRYAANGLLFPRETALRALLDELNHFEIEPLWAADETIGWIYQYFNSKEERKAMRDASQAPRNSRELAVRNQFFTPRYVVEFLVDNTLGRLWFNATGGKSALAGRCQYLLIKPDEQPQASSKVRDPRTLKLLDPACGSMHFGLYAFDLFAEIYREAWAWEQQHGPGSLDVSTQPQAALKPLCQTYEDEAAFLRDVPRLIIEHNIYGVDIDPRAAQIATLALWLRAQRAWHDASVKAKDRPRIGQSHVVAAVAPPAERELRQQLAATLDPLDAELFDKTLLLLKGLPELGVLLPIERELPSLIKKVFGEHGSLFKEFDIEQWEKAEIRLRKALNDFANTANINYQGQLFVQDALQGLRVIDIIREKFDVAVMNPPFGDPSPEYHKYKLKMSSDNLYALFVERMRDLNIDYIGAITDRTFIVQPTFDKFRELILGENVSLTALIDLGFGVLDANVQVCSYVISPNKYNECAFVDVREVEEKKCLVLAKSEGWSWKPINAFNRLPNKILAFNIPDVILDKINKWENLKCIAELPRGLGSNLAERTYRAWYEVSTTKIGIDQRWVSLSNGGDFSPYYRADTGLADWISPTGRPWVEMTASDSGRLYDQSGTSAYFRCGLSFPKQSSRFHVSVLPDAFVPTREGKAILFKKGEDCLPLMAYLNCGVVGALVRDTCGLHKQSGAIGATPICEFDNEIKNRLRQSSKIIINSCYISSSFDETSRNFLVPIFGEWPEIKAEITIGVDAAISEIEEITRALFEVGPNENAWLEKHAMPVYYEPSPFDRLSWSVGVAFGRFDLRLVSGERAVPPQSDPFDPLAVKSPGMLHDGAEPFHAHAGILVDDQGHQHDLVRLIEEVLARVKVNVPDDVRRWLQRDFFTFHLQRYSKSRRKAPIYWPLSTASGTYTLWVYYPSLNSQTLFTAVNDFLDGSNGKLTQVSRECAELRIKGSARSRDEEKQYETLQTFEQELTDLRDTLLKIAPTYQPNHDDGVQLTAAPLWQLFRHKPWQKVLKDSWTKLEKGDYDWAHLAMAYWPERVREKCKTDKSLAIAHILEDLYVEPEAAPKKTRGKKKAGGEE